MLQILVYSHNPIHSEWGFYGIYGGRYARGGKLRLVVGNLVSWNEAWAGAFLKSSTR